MTIGQRIAAKRKELALSQEALGERLGVSRQAIYKWESDAALPEIDKLIALSKLYGVSVGWLLGVEEAPESRAGIPDAPEEPEKPADELSEAQLAMVKEIVGQYLAAQPKPISPRRRRLFKASIAVAGVCLALALSNLFSELDVLRQQQDSIHSNISRVESSVNSQIDGIAGRVEEILKAQNALTADYSTEILGVDLAQNQVTFAVRAVPRIYTVDMWVEFSIDNGDTCLYVPGDPSHDEAYTAHLTCDLTDAITLSAVFTLPDGTRQTQLLDTYQGLYTASFPGVSVMDYTLFGWEAPNGTLAIREPWYVTAVAEEAAKQLPGENGATVASIQMGLFRNQALVTWAEPCDKPESFIGEWERDFYRLPPVTLEGLTGEDVLHIAALVTDSYGRRFMACEAPYVLETSQDTPHLTYPSDGRYDSDPAHWTF